MILTVFGKLTTHYRPKYRILCRDVVSFKECFFVSNFQNLTNWIDIYFWKSNNGLPIGFRHGALVCVAAALPGLALPKMEANTDALANVELFEPSVIPLRVLTCRWGRFALTWGLGLWLRFLGNGFWRSGLRLGWSGRGPCRGLGRGFTVQFPLLQLT